MYQNNVDFNKSIILTGPNAAGKTTLLKSTIINYYLVNRLVMDFINLMN